MKSKATPPESMPPTITPDTLVEQVRAQIGRVPDPRDAGQFELYRFK